LSDQALESSKRAKRHSDAQSTAIAELSATRSADSWQDADALRWAARHWAGRLGVRTPAIHIRTMTTKWGSLSRVVSHPSGGGQLESTTVVSPYAGRLTLNSELLRLPRDLGEFVIVHEVVHLLVPNHGFVFKSYLHAYLPDWRERERCLRALA
jgi:predicted metal-dependent hydrolase